MKQLGRGIGGAVLTFAFIFGVAAAASTSAQAQHRDGRDHRYNRREGNHDRERNREWRRHQRERNRDWNRDSARHDDRSRRNNGYAYGTYGRNRGYGNYGGYGNNGRYGGYNNGNQYELNRGYRQGLETGSSDGRRGQSYSPQRSRHYRNASSQAFLDGFVRGYDEGYRQYSGYGNGRFRSGNTGGFGRVLGGILGLP